MTTTTTKLRTRHARKGETHFTSARRTMGAGRPLGKGWDNQDVALVAASTGGRWCVNSSQRGIGKEMVADLEGVKKNYATQAKADRRQAALDRLAERNGEVIDY